MDSAHSPSIQYKRYPHIPLTHDMPSDVGPKRPLLEEDDFHFHARHTSTPSPSPQSESNTLSSSPAAMFLSTFMSPHQSSLNPDDQGQVISGYTLGHIIGYGSTSVIRRASSFSGDVVAVKTIRRADLVKAGNAPQARKRLQHEASIWSTLSHEHILPLFSAVYTDHADYFITLYCPAGSLFDILKRDGQPALLQDDAGMMFRQVVRGLRYLHEISQLVHRDMKLENVLVDEMGMCRISDFGMSRHIGSEDSEDEDEDEDDQLPDVPSLANYSVHRAVSLTAPSSKRLPGNLHTNHHLNRHNTVRHRNPTSSNKPVCPPGSLPYAAPELLLPQTSALQPRPSQDIWALGVMLYTLLTGCLPFTDSFEPRLQMKILKGVYSVPKDIGRGAEQILQGCLEKKISDRWNIAMVDDVAWEVGSGAEGDGATPSNPDDEPALQYRPVPRHSRPRAQHPDLKLQTFRTAIDQEEQCPRLTFEAASPGSSSRDSSLSLLSPRSPTLPDYMIPSTSSPASSPIPSYQVPSSVSSSPAVPLERGRRPRKGPQIMSRSPSRSVVPSNPNDDARASPISTIMDLDELHLDRSLRVRSTIRSSLHSNDKSDAKRVQRTVGFEDEIADWTAHTQDMESIERGDTEMHAMLKSETLPSITAAFDHHHYQQPQRAGSVPLPGPKVNNSNSYMEHRATAAEPFLNLGPAMSPSNLPRCRSAEYNRYFG